MLVLRERDRKRETARGAQVGNVTQHRSVWAGKLWPTGASGGEVMT